MTDVGGPGDVELVVPADFRHLSTVRVVSASLASHVGFDLEDLERVRVAVNELMTILVEAASSSRDSVAVAFSVAAEPDPPALHVSGSLRRDQPGSDDDAAGESPPPIALDELAERILGAVARRYDVTADGFSVTIVADTSALSMADP